MKKGIFLAATLLTLLPGSVLAQANKPAEKNDTVKFTVIKEAPITSIKDQHRSRAGTIAHWASLNQSCSVKEKEHLICVRAS